MEQSNRLNFASEQIDLLARIATLASQHYLFTQTSRSPQLALTEIQQIQGDIRKIQGYYDIQSSQRSMTRAEQQVLERSLRELLTELATALPPQTRV
tara:strand:+ start:169 stop:459 length:291 start_codon:yes stop_codon:yes gene_type:complete